ncbi:MAG TPA: hypothetical protein VME86_07340 [Acidobacteriaceae bacterium]|nr:hypothetical protein [Acidobacteriaceae bacterium]
MEIEKNDSLSASIERLNAAASLLERAAAQMGQREAAAGEVQKIVAEVEAGVSDRELELEHRLALAEQQIADLRAQEFKGGSSRKTLPAAAAQLLAKQGVTSLDSIEADALDTALTGLSLEQRIAVKSQLLRAGILN